MEMSDLMGRFLHSHGQLTLETEWVILIITGYVLYYNQWMQLLGGRENRQAWAAGNYELDSGVVLDFQIGVSKEIQIL